MVFNCEPAPNNIKAMEIQPQMFLSIFFVLLRYWYGITHQEAGVSPIQSV